MHLDLDPLLVVQHGLVTRAQAWSAGVSARQVDRMMAKGVLQPVHRGVFRDPAAPVTKEQRALAAVLASGPGSVASHRLGVSVWGAKNYECRMLEITAPGMRRIPGVRAHRSLRPPEQTVENGVPVTTPARTVLDVITVVSPGIVRRWMETWLSTDVLQLRDLERQMQLMKGHAGVPRVRAALDDRTITFSNADSPPEAALGLLLESRGLPKPTLHHLVTVSSGAEFELDWSYPDLMVAFEMDGYGVHLRSLDAFEHDRFRRNELEIDGWTVLNFTRRQVERRQATVVAQVRRIIDNRTVRGLPRQGS